MPLKRTPPPSGSASPLLSAFATPLQHCLSDSNVSEVGQEAGVSAASSSGQLSTKSSGSIATTRKNSMSKRKRGEETGDPRAGIEDDNITYIKEMLNTFQKQQDAKFAAILSSVNDVKMSVDFMATKYEEALRRIDNLEAERKRDKSYILQLESKLEMQDHNSRCTSLEIRNISHNTRETKEDLKNIINSTAQHLNIPLQNSEIKDVYRVNTKSAVKPIIVDFTTVSLRNSFLKSVKQYNKTNQNNRLNTSNIRIEGPIKPIYFSENLTQRERKLFYLGREFSKTQGYAYCWTSFGRVFLRKREGSPQIRIFSETDFEKLMHQNN